MISSVVHELQNPTLSGICCGKTLMAGGVAIALLGYAFVGAPIVGSALTGETLGQSFELGLGGLCSALISGAAGLWSGLIMECNSKLNWKQKASIAGGIAATSYLTSPIWFQSPTLSIPALKIYAANGVGITLGTAALVVSEASFCLYKASPKFFKTDSSESASARAPFIQ